MIKWMNIAVPKKHHLTDNSEQTKISNWGSKDRHSIGKQESGSLKCNVPFVTSKVHVKSMHASSQSANKNKKCHCASVSLCSMLVSVWLAPSSKSVTPVFRYHQYHQPHRPPQHLNTGPLAIRSLTSFPRQRKNKICNFFFSRLQNLTTKKQ